MKLAPWILLLALSTRAQAAEGLAFRTGILPILTKAGCNAGACHGAATGQGGFKLSLLGYDPEQDYEHITREFGGRRIDPLRPAESLVLRKPTRQLPHEGGRRLARSSESYATLLRWIAEGAQYGPPALSVTAITVTPADALLVATNQTVALKVTASLSDGSMEAVTALALYTSNNDAVAEVSGTGTVTTRGSGATSIMVRYSGQVAAALVAVPFPGAASDQPPFEVRNFVDHEVAAELKRLRLPASPLSSNAEFLRRVSLDLIGRLPTPSEARDFLAADGDAITRERLIESLLARDEFVDLWTLHLEDLLLVGGKGANEAATRVYHAWLREQIARNVPFDQLVRDLITASGRLSTTGPANFYTLANDPRDLAEHVGRMFLGTQIACARCHAHPADRWTQLDYHQFAAYFSRITHDGQSIQPSGKGEVEEPKTHRALVPKPLGGPQRQAPLDEDRRVPLAAWMTSPGNPFFARTIANRIWKHLLGRGLVEPVDDLRPTNPPTHPKLLDALASAFVRSGYDLRALIKTIASSHTYQLSSATCAGNSMDDAFYSHALLKKVPAQVFLDMIAQVTGLPDTFDQYPAGTKAVQLIGARAPSYALDVLGRCLRDRACDGIGVAGGGLAQALHLINGDTINEKLRGGCVTQWLASGWTDRAMIEEMYLRAFTRRPEPPELTEWERLMSSAPGKAEAVEDLLWAILNSREFAFNH